MVESPILENVTGGYLSGKPGFYGKQYNYNYYISIVVIDG